MITIRQVTSIALLTLALGACESQTTTPAGGTGGTGGTSANGGTQGSGGVTVSGGASGSLGKGGVTGGGGSGSGGVILASGGASGPGGATSTSAAGGSAGRTGVAGGPGRGGATSSGGESGGAGAGGSTGPTDGGGQRDLAPADASKDLPADTGSVADDAGTQSCPAGRPAPTAGDSNVTLQSGGRSRKYILHAPSGLTAGTALAVVIDLHGAGGNGSQQKGMSGFSSLADKEKFLAVFPDGIDGYWNVDDKCCGTAGEQKIDDVGFLKAIIAKLGTDTCIDAKRIYVTGFSNGGGLTHRMGCDAADVIAAIAPMATDLRTQPCNATRPISMMEIRGMADSLEPYEGGMVGPAGGQYLAVGAKASLKLWADIDKCTGTTTTIEKYCESYTQCGDGVEADLCSLPNVDHSPYGNSLGFNVASAAWSMFKRQPMK
jgi:poly(3-hydroxybutyrate) depolymerase